MVVQDPLKNTQFERGHIPTDTEIKNRVNEANKLLTGSSGGGYRYEIGVEGEQPRIIIKGEGEPSPIIKKSILRFETEQAERKQQQEEIIEKKTYAEKLKDKVLSLDLQPTYKVYPATEYKKPYISEWRSNLNVLWYKYSSSVDRLSEPIISKDSILKTKIPVGDISEYALFGFFSPYLSSGQQAITSAISRGELRPLSKTKFYSEIEDVGEGVSKVKTIYNTEIGGIQSVGSGMQYVKLVSKKEAVGFGRTQTMTKLVKGETRLSESVIISKSKDIGKAILKEQTNILGTDAKLISKQVIGRKIKSMSISQEMKSKDIVNLYGIKYDRMIQSEMNLNPSKKIQTDLLKGFVRKIGSKKYSYIGSTEGTLKYPNVIGVIKIKMSGGSAETIPLRSLTLKTKYVSRLVQPILSDNFLKNIIKAESKQSSNLLPVKTTTKLIAEEKLKTGLKQILLPREKEKSMFKVSSTPILKESQIMKEETKLKSKEILKYRTDFSTATIQKDSQAFKLEEQILLKQQPKLKEREVLKLRNPNMERNIYPIYSFKLRPRRSSLPAFKLFQKTSRPKSKAGKKYKPKETFGISEDFISRVLGRKGIKITKKNLNKNIFSSPFTIRRRPIIKM